MINLDDIAFKEGFEKGATTHFNSIDAHYRLLKGNVILFGGMGNYGKSKLVKQICLLRSIKNNEKWAWFTPEENPPEYFYMDLIHSYVGRSPYKWHKNQMTIEEFEDGMKFIKDHFYFLYPKDDNPTPDYINERFEDAINQHKIDGCIIDPFNQLYNDWETSGRDDRYINAYLKAEKRFALKHNIYKITIHHTKSNVQKTATNDYQMPSVYDLHGGAMWNNGCDEICFVHRPYRESDSTNSETIFKSAKIKKQILCGVPGEVNLKFDLLSNRYLENGISPFDKSIVVEELFNSEPLNEIEDEKDPF
jgi:twinkle protein